MKILILLLCLGPFLLQAQAPKEEIEPMLTSFVDDLNHLRLDPFISNFAEDATIFFPREFFPIERVSGREDIRKQFGRFFETLRENREGPNYLNIVPENREINIIGDNVAIVSLNFIAGEEYHRRSIILHKAGNDWKILHLHASFLQNPTP